VADKEKDLDQGVLRNFDQLLTYFLSLEGRRFNYFYGITTILNQWQFCGYNRPNLGELATKHNFRVSKVRNLNKDHDNLPMIEPLSDILTAIIGSLSDDVDMIVEENIN